MTDKDDYIRERTNKGFGDDLYKRLRSTPVDEKKAFAWLVNHLYTKGHLSVEEFETMLYDARPVGG
jgi:hypothetical protein